MKQLVTQSKRAGTNPTAAAAASLKVVEAMNDEVTETLQFDAIPALNIYDRSGELREQFIGEVTHEELEQLVEKLLTEAKP